MSLRLDATALEPILRHCQEAYPLECCGLLVGTAEGELRVALEAPRAANLETERPADRYTLDPNAFVEADRDARARGLDVVGIYHSHPDHPSRPSTLDLERAWEGYSYLIVEVTRGGVASYQSWVKRDGRFDPEPVVTT
jgi:proteasome lid subunit RPN8/RPN11